MSTNKASGRLLLAGIAFQCLLLLLCVNTAQARSGPATEAGSWVKHDVGLIKNEGQVMNEKGEPVKNVLYYSSLNKVSFYVTGSGISYVFTKSTGQETGKKEHIEWCRIDLDLKGGNIDAGKVIASGEVPGAMNYFTPSAPQGVSASMYKQLTFPEVYPGIDWVLYFDEVKGVEYDFVVHPGADPGMINTNYSWASGVKAEQDGKKLVIETPMGSIEEGDLYSYIQEDKAPVESRFVVKGTGVSIALGDYDKSKTLIIDPPVLVWATYYGGSSVDAATSVTTDANTGDVYVSGFTQSTTSFPTLNPGGSTYFQGSGDANGDAFLVKFNSSGVRQWATYYGGSTSDKGEGVAVDNSGNIYWTGCTLSSNFPVQSASSGYYQSTLGGSDDAFAIKFNSSGVRLWATYYGGSSGDYGSGIAVDASGNFYITGLTNSTNFPTVNPGGGAYYQSANAGVSDAFIVKFNSSYSNVWSTYYGGSGGDAITSMNGHEGYGICIDGSSNIYVTGYTGSTNFPTQNPGGGAYYQGANGGVNDAFILKFNSSAVRQWATYYGGNSSDYGFQVATDANGTLYVVGYAWSSNLPTTNPGGGAYYQGARAGNRDAMILKFNSSLACVWATYYGGGGSTSSTEAYCIDVDASNNVYMTGWTNSTTFPTTNPGGGAFYQGSLSGGADIVIAKFNSSAVVQWATYYPGTGSDYGYGVEVGPWGCVYVVGYEGSTTGFTTLNPGGAYYQSANAGNVDAYILSFCSASNPVADAGPDYSVCRGTTATLGGSPTAQGGTSPYTYSWSPTTGLSSATVANPVCSATVTTTYTVTVTDATGAWSSDVVVFTVKLTPLVGAGTDQTICSGNCATIGSSYVQKFTAYAWTPATGLSCTTCQSTTACPTTTTTYTIVATNALSGCTATDQVTITVNPSPVANAGPDGTACCGTIFVIGGTGGSPTGSGGTAPYTYSWNPGTGLNSTTTANPSVNVCTAYSIGQTISYTVTVTDANGCTATDVVNIQRTCRTINPDLLGTVTEPLIVSVMPNPTSGSFEVSVENQGTGYSIEIFNMIGELVYEKQGLTEDRLSVDMDKVAKGVYILKVTSNTGKSHIGKVLVE
jgi:hypothetical protein